MPLSKRKKATKQEIDREKQVILQRFIKELGNTDRPTDEELTDMAKKSLHRGNR